VAARPSILVQGLTNSGKTSVVNALTAVQVVPPNPLPNTVDHTAIRRDGATTAARAVGWAVRCRTTGAWGE
jgi:50S ribosomal subunit-associated GTPase HflX